MTSSYTNNVSAFVRSVATNFLGQEEYQEQERTLSDMFDPVDLGKNATGRHKRSHNAHKHLRRNNSTGTAQTDNDSAWLYSGYGETAMDDFSETDDETIQWQDDINESPSQFQCFPNNKAEIASIKSARKKKKRKRHSKTTKHNRKKHRMCDTTTVALLALCIVLSAILVIMLRIVDPFRINTNTINTSINGTDVDESTTQQPSNFMVPTMAPIISPQSSARLPTKSPVNKAAVSDSTNINIKSDVPSLSMGPMVGHTTHDSVTLWAYHEFTDDAIEILIYDYDSDVLLQKINFDSSRSDRNNAFLETIQGLQPSTSYKYGMHVRDERVGKGSFTTAPAPNSNNGTQFDYVLASCINYRQYQNQIVWDVIADKLGGKYPDFSILAGDTVYLQEGVDVTNENGVIFDRLWTRNREQRNEPHFADFIAHVPTYATWNDHEYGNNNANKDQKGKGNSLRAWESLWPNPGYGDKDTDDGVYYSFYWGDVHYIVTDDHWYRDPSQKNRLGSKQTEWMENELINSKGTFKVIVIGSDIMERGWETDLDNIGTIVRENRINGVLFHAGDIHRNEYKEMITGGFPYPVKQITSSGIAKVWRRPFVHIRVDTKLYDPSMTAYFYGASSTAQITSWTNDPSLKCSSIVGIDRSKEHTCTETIRLSDLTVPLI